MAETESGGKGTDPNEDHDMERARGKDHQETNLSEASNKGHEPPDPFKITHAG